MRHKSLYLTVLYIILSYLLVQCDWFCGEMEEKLNWTQIEGIPWASRRRHASVVFDNKMWIIGGEHYIPPDNPAGLPVGWVTLSDVWYSEEGITWQPAGNIPYAASGHSAAVYDNQIWVIGEVIDDTPDTHGDNVFYSDDGMTWTVATDMAPRRWGHTSPVFDNRLWMIGGHYTAHDTYSGELLGHLIFDHAWWSTDGTNWEMATENPGWEARTEHASVVFDDKVWVICGIRDIEAADNVSLVDVWNSDDGTSWTQVNVAVNGDEGWGDGWGALQCVVFDNKIWLIDGWGGAKYHTWYSEDGSKWYPANNPDPFPIRGAHTCLAFNDKIWVLGGRDDIVCGDVWYGEKTD